MFEFPTPEQIWAVFETLLAGRKPREIRKRTDSRGIILWEVRSADDPAVVYTYLRDGILHPRIDIIYFSEDRKPIGVDPVAKFIENHWVFSK
jgi:hypothetical protein